MTIRASDLNNLGEAVHIWGKGYGSSAEEYVFFGDADDLANSTLLLSLYDEIDIDNDGIADYMTRTSSPAVSVVTASSLVKTGHLYLEVDMEPIGGGAEIEGIIGLIIPEPATLSLLAFVCWLCGGDGSGCVTMLAFGLV